MLKIHEFSSPGGELVSIELRLAGAALEIVSAESAWPLPAGVLGAVLTRFGAPFDADARITDVARLELGHGEALRHVRHLAGYDVIARDYLVYERAGDEAVCALAATVAAALLHLGRAAAV